MEKTYTLSDKLIIKTIWVGDSFDSHSKFFYEGTGKLKYDLYFKKSEDHKSGKCLLYFEDREIREEREYCKDSPFELPTGTWNSYLRDGTLDGQTEYLEEVIKRDNGKNKSAGAFYFDDYTNQWLTNGEWKWYKENGELDSSKKYKSGVEVIN
jgi:antitoxin component YwqK of YwqJK toxin-antitoxin module